MFRVGGWLSGSKSLPHGGTRSLTALDELSQIEDAMAAVAHIMDDDVETAEKQLSEGNSPFHQLGKGVVTFMRATLGFEQEIMREASNTLSEAENAAYTQQRHANRSPHAYQSSIYQAGTEYAVCQAEAQLMSAIVGVLNESLAEAIKSFYKLRKAYLTLESVMEAEARYLRERSSGSLSTVEEAVSSRPSSRRSNKSDRSKPTKPHSPLGTRMTGSTTSMDSTSSPQPLGSSTKGDRADIEEIEDEFFDADEDPQEAETPMEYVGHLGVPTDGEKVIEVDSTKPNVHLKPSSAPDLHETPEESQDSPSSSIERFAELTLSETVKTGEDISLYGDHPVDMFIMSGSNFCFGVLLLLMSLVPPSFSKLLKIVGFKGDRERGIQMLWQATKFHNIHGGLAGLVLFGFYNGITGFCDIVPPHGEGSHPKERCMALLANMRKRFPKSHLWLLEEARMLAADKELEKAVTFMDNVSESPLKQLEALSFFEKSLNTMFMHDFEGTSAAFQMCVTLNNWSHGLYYYICGAAHVELYRRNKTKDPKEAKRQAALAVDLFKKVPSNTGKKRFMARQLPFDIFINRKIQKWEARAAEWKCDLVDAIGVSPLEEMIYFWNGYKRMRDDHLQVSLDSLVWSESADNPHWEKEGLDEKAILALLRAATLRSMGKLEKARSVLKEEIMKHDKALFKGHLRDSWTAPVARYESAAIAWTEANQDEKPEDHPQLLDECKMWLEEVSKWEGFDLDARIGLKVTTGKTTLRRYGVEC